VLTLPRYKSHKTVKAAKILEVTQDEATGAMKVYTLHLEGGIAWHVDHDWCCKHCVWNPTPAGAPEELPAVKGGYLIEYDDGYTSYSPQKAFEEGYTKLEPPKAAPEIHPATAAILKFFECSHLPPRLQIIVQPFTELAFTIVSGPQNAETTVALRKLLEAKDCAVRAAL